MVNLATDFRSKWIPISAKVERVSRRETYWKIVKHDILFKSPILFNLLTVTNAQKIWAELFSIAV